jgi:hypothetical protein
MTHIRIGRRGSEYGVSHKSSRIRGFGKVVPFCSVLWWGAVKVSLGEMRGKKGKEEKQER